MSKKKILIVDDDEGILLMLKLLLRLEGYEAVICEEASQVLEKMIRESPDLVILDAMMPYLDGLSVLKLVQSKKLSQAPPVILLTGRVDESYTKQALTAGASSVLIKPFVKEELLEKVRTLLDKR